MLTIVLSVDPLMNDVAVDEDADIVALFLCRPSKESSEDVNKSSFWYVRWKREQSDHK